MNLIWPWLNVSVNSIYPIVFDYLFWNRLGTSSYLKKNEYYTEYLPCMLWIIWRVWLYSIKLSYYMIIQTTIYIICLYTITESDTITFSSKSSVYNQEELIQSSQTQMSKLALKVPYNFNGLHISYTSQLLNIYRHYISTTVDANIICLHKNFKQALR